MQNSRHNARLDWNRLCHLHCNGSSYQATVKDLSVMVMGLHFDGSLPDVEIGDVCVVKMVYDQVDLHDEFNCQVMRSDTSEIALRIIGRHKD